jgi:hypothetical protein
MEHEPGSAGEKYVTRRENDPVSVVFFGKMVEAGTAASAPRFEFSSARGDPVSIVN